jgi:hypothetical protein
MNKRIALSLVITAALFAADKTPAPTLLEMAAKKPMSRKALPSSEKAPISFG